MIHIFFVTGMFGSTIEYMLRSFTKEYTPITCEILSDGSMHAYDKEFHPATVNKLSEFFTGADHTTISTPYYPFKNKHLTEILNSYKPYLTNNYSILLYADSIQSAEINLLFKYYKIAFGTKINIGFEIFCGNNVKNIIKWNNTYRHWSEMQRWELREWVSLFYSTWVQEWINSKDQVPATFLKIKNTDMLFNTKNTFLKIIKFCNLTVANDNNQLDNFISEGAKKQTYIIKEFNTLNQIIENSINNLEFNWGELNVISEAIIQQRLRTLGYEIRCNNLNIFPTDAKTLYSLLERC